MRRCLYGVVWLLACSESTGVLSACAGTDCRLPASLTLAATLDPPVDSALSGAEFPPEELVQDSDGVLQLAFPESIETTLSAVAADAPETRIAAQILLSRPSRIAGQPDVLVQVDTTSDMPAVTRTNLGAAYDVVVTPAAPEDERYLRVALHGVDLDSGALELPLQEPGEAIQGTLNALASLDVHVRLQGSRDDSEERTTVARVRPGDEFAMKALDVAGQWRVGAEVTFVDPADKATELPNLHLDIEALVVCEAAPCVLSLPAVPTGSAPVPRRHTIEVTGVDPAGISVAIPGVYVDLRSTVPAIGVESATISAQAVTRKDGTAEVYLLDGRGYDVDLRAGGSGFASTTTAVSVPEGTQEDRLIFNLEIGPRLAGTVVAAHPTDDRAGLAGVVVLPSPSPGQGDESPSGGVTAPPTTDDQGAFSVRLDPGVYDLDLTPPQGSGYPRWSSDNVQAFEDTSGLQVVLPDGVLIPVHVRAMGGPVGGATLRILAISETEGRPPRERAQGMTDPLGDATVLLPNP